jgi:putative CocE/NonD family hydrolase
LKKISYKAILWILLAFFCFRVCAQLFQFFFHSDYLPDFNEFQSGTLSYSMLVFFQLVIIAIYLTTCIRVNNNTFIVNREKGKRLLILGIIYLTVMAVRYILQMSMFPSERWFGGSIPIFFHMVLAAFIITIGLYNLNFSVPDLKNRRLTNILWIICYVIIGTLIAAWIFYQILPTIVASKIGMRRAIYSVRIDKKVPIKTSDGTLLLADIYKPEKLSKAPTILVRIPLDNNFKGLFMSNLIGRLWAERGYNVVVQGVRGRYFSTGNHVPFKNERQDGISTLKWLNKQPWHNGKCGMWGGSYFGYTQWVLSDQDSLGLSAMMTQISSSSNYDMFYNGGAFSYQSALFWVTRSYSTIDLPLNNKQLNPGFNGAPLISADRRVVGNIPFFKAWVTHENKDAYWIAVDGVDRAKNIKVPILMMDGWYDPYLTSQIRDFENVSSNANKNIGSQSELIIGPWAHAETIIMPDGYNDGNYRLASIAPSIDWFDRTLYSMPIKQLGRVKLFVMGINKWRYENEFPLNRTLYTSYYLSLAKQNGSLSPITQTQNLVKSYIYDPEKPLHSLGGSVLGEGAGPYDQRESEMRKDVLTFNTSPLNVNTEVTGKIKLLLYVSTDVKNTDFVAKLTDVYPDGRVYNISEGIIRRTFHGKDSVEKIEIELNPTSNVFLKNHRIGLEVTSSNYPRYSLNYNTGGNQYNETKGIAAEQKVYFGTGYPSQIILPIIPAKP